MDVSDASYYIFNEKEIKVAEWGTPKKYLKKKRKLAIFKFQDVGSSFYLLRFF
jgi:hypothetical protein